MAVAVTAATPAAAAPSAARANGTSAALPADSAPAPVMVVAPAHAKPAAAAAAAVSDDMSLARILQRAIDSRGGAAKARGLDGSLFSFLVDELLVAIFAYLPPRHVARLSLVCKDFQRVSHDTPLWRELFKQFYPGVEFETRSLDGWKHTFAAGMFIFCLFCLCLCVCVLMYDLSHRRRY